MSDNVETKTEIKSITSIDQITKIIKRKEVAYASHYMIPSLKREVPFTEINTSQQKRLVKSTIDSSIFNTEFIYTLREILKENCQDETVNIDELTILDKLVIALALRMRSVGEDVKIEVETKDGTKVNTTLNISKILQIVLSTVENIPNFVTEDAYYLVECSIPTIGTEFRLEKELRSKSSNTEIENIEELRQTIGDAFIGEVVKYINKVSIKMPDSTLVPVEWQRFTFAERIKVVETFKTNLLKNILDYINIIRKEVDKVELIKFEFNGEKYERRLSIDSDFFTIS